MPHSHPTVTEGQYQMGRVVGTTKPANANGHRRRQLTRRIKATATHCALCQGPLSPDATWPADDCTVIDEDIPRAKGGSPLDPHNCSAMHNMCNRFKGTMTLAEARELLAAGAVTARPLSRAQRRSILTPSLGIWEPAASTW